VTGKKWLEYIVTAEDAGNTVESVLRNRLGVSGRMLQRLTRSKGIQLNRKSPYLQRPVKEGDRLEIRISDQPGVQAGAAIPAEEEIPLDILYADEHFLVVNKPAGMMVHPVNGESGTLVAALAAWLRRQGENAAPHPVHRLDKDTSGAILVAKSGYAHQLADRLLREGGIEREYLAVVTGRLAEDQGVIDAPIGRDPSHRVKRKVTAQGEPAVTRFIVLARSEQYSLVRIQLETGRTHQIRVHFAHLGHPLAGDTLYGGKRYAFTRQALHAERLVFPHPVTGEELSLRAEPPADLNALLQRQFPGHKVSI